MKREMLINIFIPIVELNVDKIKLNAENNGVLVFLISKRLHVEQPRFVVEHRTLFLLPDDGAA